MGGALWICVALGLIDPSYGVVDSPSLLLPMLSPEVYDRLMPPRAAENITTDVSVDLYVTELSAINAGHMDYRVDFFLRLNWTDPRLAYNATLSNRTGHLSTQSQHVYDAMWWPDVYFDNSKAARFKHMTTANRLLRFFPDGQVYTSRRVAATLSCTMALKLYPSDIQKCPVKILNYMSTTSLVRLSWLSGNETDVIVEKMELPDFKVLRPTLVWDCNGSYVTGVFSCLMCEFRFRRYIGYHMFQMFLPSTAVVSISWISFWISPRAVPARATLSITTFLALSTQSSGLRHSLPAVSYATAVDIWIAICTVFVYGSLLEFALAYHLFENEESRDTAKRVASRWELAARSTKRASVVPAAAKAAEGKPHQESGANGDASTERSSAQSAGSLLVLPSVTTSGRAEAKASLWRRARELFTHTRVDNTSRWLFPLLFLLSNVIFWTRYEFLPNAASANIDCPAGDMECYAFVRQGYGLK